jgi:hypothetical protein
MSVINTPIAISYQNEKNVLFITVVRECTSENSFKGLKLQMHGHLASPAAHLLARMILRKLFCWSNYFL